MSAPRRCRQPVLTAPACRSPCSTRASTTRIATSGVPAPRLHRRVWRRGRRSAERDARRTVSDRQSDRGLRLRRRGLAQRPLAPDRDPIDFEGHGTHVADIIAGRASTAHKGSPRAQAARAESLQLGVDLLQRRCAASGHGRGARSEWRRRPVGRGRRHQHVARLGLRTRRRRSCRSEHTAVEFGVVVVAAAGNAADRPYIVGSPSVAPRVISVAQTNVPTATASPSSSTLRRTSREPLPTRPRLSSLRSRTVTGACPSSAADVPPIDLQRIA